MSDNTLGILIILSLIGIGIFTGGSIFKGPAINTNGPVGTEISDVNSMIVPDQNTVTEQQRRKDLEEQIAQTQEQIRLLQIEIDKNTANKNASIYKGKVFISSVVNPDSLFGYINISTIFAPGESVNITGWRIRSMITGNEETIGKAVNLPRSSGPGSAEKDLILSANSNIVLSEFPSSLGYSFRVNKCTGYLAQDANFTPPLPKACPAAKDTAPHYSNEFNNACLDYISRLHTCEIPTENTIPEEESLSFSCKNYLTTQINYNTCVAAHQNDRDFYSTEWRLYPKTAQIRWLERRDTLQLLDNAGKVVTTYSY